MYYNDSKIFPLNLSRISLIILANLIVMYILRYEKCSLSIMM